MLLVAGAAAVEMGPEPREHGVRVGVFHLELEVAVEQLEARLAADLEPDRPERPRPTMSHHQHPQLASRATHRR